MTSGWVSAIAEFITAVVAVLFGAYQLYLATIGKWRQDAEQVEASEREGARLKNSAEAICVVTTSCVLSIRISLARICLALIWNESPLIAMLASLSAMNTSFLSWLTRAKRYTGCTGHEPDWMDSILDELDWHAEYLTSDYFADLSPNYGSRHKEHYIGNEAVRDPAASDVTSRSG